MTRTGQKPEHRIFVDAVQEPSTRGGGGERQTRIGGEVRCRLYLPVEPEKL